MFASIGGKLFLIFDWAQVLYRFLYGPLAQLVEQLAFNQLVAGSNPARPTITANHPRVVFLIYRDDGASQ